MSVGGENIRIPVWLWTLLGIAIAFAFTHTIQQYLTAERVEALRADHDELVDGMGTDLREVRVLIREVRDDVLILKTRDSSANSSE